MEGMMMVWRPKPPPWPTLAAPSPTARRTIVPAPFVPAGSSSPRQQWHSSTCRLATTLPSIWHAITPSPDSTASVLHRRRLLRSHHMLFRVDEGSWNAAWDVRPARWLHGSDSAWLLFGVCSCFSSSFHLPQAPTSSAAAEQIEPAGGDKQGDKGDGDIKEEEKDADTCSRRYKVTGMLADGRCLFRAVSYGSCLVNGNDTPDELQQAELADDLRARVADELLKRRDEMERFVEEDFDAYVKNIRQPYVWGGEPELLMASHVLQRPVSVFVLDAQMDGLVNIANYGVEYGEAVSIKVLFHGYGHYDALEVLTGGCKHAINV